MIGAVKFISITEQSKGRRGKGKRTHTDSKIRFPWSSKSEAVETNWSRGGPRLQSNILRRGCRLHDRGAAQGWSESRWRVIAHLCGGREAQLAREGIREHEAYLVNEMRAPAGTGRGGVSMTDGRQGQGAWSEGLSFAITAMFCSEFTYAFVPFVSVREVASEYLFAVLIHMNLYMFHIYFLVKHIFNIQPFCILEVIISRHTRIWLLPPHGERVTQCTHTSIHSKKKKGTKIPKRNKTELVKGRTEETKRRQT